MVDISVSWAMSLSMTVQPNDEIVLASAILDGSWPAFRVGRLTANGDVDTSFVCGGVTTTDFAAGAGTPGDAAVVMSADGADIIVERLCIMGRPG